CRQRRLRRRSRHLSSRHHRSKSQQLSPALWRTRGDRVGALDLEWRRARAAASYGTDAVRDNQNEDPTTPHPHYLRGGLRALRRHRDQRLGLDGHATARRGVLGVIGKSRNRRILDRLGGWAAPPWAALPSPFG